MNEKYLGFDGTTTKVDLGTVESLDLDDDFTIELYVLFDGDVAPGPIFGIGDDGTTTSGKSLGLSISDDMCLQSQIMGAAVIKGPVIDKVGSRFHIAFSYDESAKKVILRINGESYHSAVSTIAFSPDATALVVLGISDLQAGYFSGGMTEVRFFNVVRSQAGIKQTLFRRLSGIEERLTGYFPLDGLEGDSDTAARDAKVVLDPITLEPKPSSRPSGTITGGTWIPSDLPLRRPESSDEVVVGAFDGVASHIVVPHSDSLTLDTFTIEAWVRPTGTGRPYYTYPVVSKHAVNQGWELRAGNGRGGFLIATSNGYVDINEPLENDVWHFLTASYDGATLCFYVNGFLRSTTSVSGTFSPCSEAMNIGRNPYWQEHRFEGQIAEIRVFHGVRDPYFTLSAQRPIWTDANVIAAHYHLDASADDLSPSGSNHGTATNVLWVASDPPLPPSSESARTAITLDPWDKNVLLRLENARLTEEYSTAVSNRKSAQQDLSEAQKTSTERANERQELESKVAELKELPAKIAELDQTIADVQDQIRQIKAGRGEISVTDFAMKLQSEFQNARNALTSGGMGGTLARMNFQVKTVPGSGGTTLMFPSFATVQSMGSNKMSTLEIGFEAGRIPDVAETQVDVPNVIGSTEALAKRILSQSNLVGEIGYQAIEPSSQGTFTEADRVVTQLPAAGSTVPVGSKVTLFLGRETGT